MCAIVDANVANEVFGPNPTPAGEMFFNWLNKGSNRLVVGGKQLEELETGSPNFRHWAREVARSGNMKILNEGRVLEMTARIERERRHTSDDPHVLAVARLSSARLLYSNDADLQRDFKNKQLIDDPRGKVYSTTRENKDFTITHRRLLRRKDLCRT